MGIGSDLMLKLAPGWIARRERDRMIAMHYRAARLGRNSDSLNPSRADADRASTDRARIAAYMRDMIRNTPFAARGQAVITNNVVGDGIIPKLEIRSKMTERAKAFYSDLGLRMIEDSLDTTAIDMRGLQNLYGLQRLVTNTIADAGEVLIRRHRVETDGRTLPLKLEVLEPDYIDSSRLGRAEDGGEIREGIEYNAAGQRVAYWLYTQHPGGDYILGRNSFLSERVPAADILHVFRVDRPGQSRGVSWFSPVAEKLMIFDDYEDAQLIRQQIASCFTAFRRLGSSGEAEKINLGGKLSPGSIMDIGIEDEMAFANPPGVDGYDEFTGRVLRAAAMGLGITYESLTGDLTGVNFSSARIGRLEMDRNVSSWQWLMMVPMMMQPLGEWILEAWADAEPRLWNLPDFKQNFKMTWVPPVRILVDPAREFSALNEAVRSGFQSRQGVVRQLGVDPERLRAEQLEDKLEADRLGLLFDSDPRADVSRKGQKAADQEEKE